MSGNRPIRVVIAEDNALVRDGLRRLLTNEQGLEVAGETVDWMQTLACVSKLQPDVVLLNANMPEMNDMEDISLITRRSPKTKLLILPVIRDEALLFQALKAGAKGYLSKDASGTNVAKAIRMVHQGELWLERRLIAKLVETENLVALDKRRRGARAEVLTSRETEILRQLASGATNKEIGNSLSISEKTVKSHLSNIFRKLQITRRQEAILYALHQGLK